jgi:hypothetical protein
MAPVSAAGRDSLGRNIFGHPVIAADRPLPIFVPLVWVGNRADAVLGLPDDQARFASTDPGSVLLAAHQCGYILDYLQAGVMVTRRGRGRGRGRGRDALHRNDRGDIVGENG